MLFHIGYFILALTFFNNIVVASDTSKHIDKGFISPKIAEAAAKCGIYKNQSYHINSIIEYCDNELEIGADAVERMENYDQKPLLCYAALEILQARCLRNTGTNLSVDINELDKHKETNMMLSKFCDQCLESKSNSFVDNTTYVKGIFGILKKKSQCEKMCGQLDGSIIPICVFVFFETPDSISTVEIKDKSIQDNTESKGKDIPRVLPEELPKIEKTHINSDNSPLVANRDLMAPIPSASEIQNDSNHDNARLVVNNRKTDISSAKTSQDSSVKKDKAKPENQKELEKKNSLPPLLSKLKVEEDEVPKALPSSLKNTGNEDNKNIEVKDSQKQEEPDVTQEEEIKEDTKIEEAKEVDEIKDDLKEEEEEEKTVDKINPAQKTQDALNIDAEFSVPDQEVQAQDPNNNDNGLDDENNRSGKVETKEYKEPLAPVEPSDEKEIKYVTQNNFVETKDSLTFTYLMIICICSMVIYTIACNKTKIIAMVLEGRKRRGRRRPRTAGYSKLDTNLEEAMHSAPACSGTTSMVY